VFVVAPTPALRRGLASLIENPGMAVSGDARTIEEAIASRADVIVSTTGPAAETSPSDRRLRLVLLTGDELAARDLAEAGFASWGVVSPAAGAAELQAAIAAVAAGLVVMPPAVAQSRAALPGPDERGPFEEHLTDREREVLELAGQGFGNREIARQLGISDHTVKFHLSTIYGKLGVSGRTEAIRLGLRRGLISL
jgi:DNA-binding NarL/FixJ family response regulator